MVRGPGARGTAARVLRAALLLVVLAGCMLVGFNLDLNVWLPVILNRQPERLKVEYDVAWVLWPSHVEVRGLHIRAQSPKDQWTIDVDSASGEIDTYLLFEHTFRAYDVQATGASFRYRSRLDASGGPGPTLGPVSQVPIMLQGTEPVLTPEIPGLSNPPSPDPEQLYGPPRRPWRVRLDGVVVQEVRELWVGHYRFSGDARVSGAMELLAAQSLSLTNVRLDLAAGRVLLGDAPVLNSIQGHAVLDLDEVNPAAASGAEVLGHMSARVDLRGEVQSLSFLDFYLESVRSLGLSSATGDLAVAVAIDHGDLQVGSTVTAHVRDLAARFMSYSIVGDGAVALVVEPRPPPSTGGGQTRMVADFRDFAITRDGDVAPHVRGEGFRVSTTSPDTALNQPFTAAEVIFVLPDSEIPDVKVYNAYMPLDLGVILRSGTGRVHGTLTVTTGDNVGSGELHLSGDEVGLKFDDLSVTTDVAVHVRVPEARLSDGRYTISGSTLQLTGLRVVQAKPTRHGKDGSKGWWAKFQLGHGTVRVGAPVFLDASVAVKMRDTVPLVTIFSQAKKLPGWLRGMLAFDGVSGEARVLLGDEVVEVPRLAVRGDKFELQLRLRRERALYHGNLFARYGILAVGVDLQGKTSRVVLRRPRAWFDGLAD